MSGYKVDGTVSFSDTEDSVVFCLKSSDGRDLKSYRVPAGNADAFAEGIKSEAEKLRVEAGEKDPLRLIKISRCF